MAEIRFDSATASWKIWDPNTLSFIEPAASTNLSGYDTVVFNANTPTGESFDALAGSDTYLIQGDFGGSFVLQDPQSASGSLNSVVFGVDTSATSVELRTITFGAQQLVITLANGGVVTVIGIGGFDYSIEGMASGTMTAAEFASTYENGWVGAPPSNAVFDNANAEVVLMTIQP